jgi:glycyl-tRNA synthetase beta chain
MAKRKAAAPATETLLVELLTEELPPKALKALSETFAQALADRLRQRDLLSGGSEVQAFATPRRLAASITKVLARGQDKPVEVAGPSAKVALDADGKPTQALLGFAKKQGVEVSQLERRNTSKGDVFVYRALAKGGYLNAALGLEVEDALEKLPVPKIMRWGAGAAEFVRPVHGLVMLHGSKVVAGEVLGAKSTNRTAGHRFLASGPVLISHAARYEGILRTKGKVEPAFGKRKQLISEKLARTGGKEAELVADEALLEEITALVEWPAVYAGGFSPEFLEVPPECLILSMQQHQKYVPLRDRKTGKLLPRFLFVSNLEIRDPREIIHGNERVLRARLADAKFFYDQDRKVRLETRVPQLAKVVYHSKLGTQLERTQRIKLLTGEIARRLGADVVPAERAAELAKADLLTGMVGEFPELQGIMGRYYALADDEDPRVADAIEQHYRPRFAGDKLPEGTIACAVALADKLDALAGLFSIREQPSGDKDPFGLRRAAVGVVRIIVENKLALSLLDLSEAAFEPYKSKSPIELVEFVYDRFASYLKDLGFSTLQVDAVLSRRTQPSLVPKQLEAVRAFQALPEAESLVAANKRVANILRQAEAKGEKVAEAKHGELKEPAERALHDAIRSASEKAMALFDRGDYAGYLTTFSVLKSPIDAFFDSVMVMVDDPTLRRGRLALLRDLREAMNRVADISKLAVEK